MKKSTKTTWNKTKPHKVPAYLSWLHNSGQTCIVCGSSNIELHHVKSKSQRLRDDRLCVTLCSNHHTGAKFSVHATPKEFERLYATSYLMEIAAEKFAEYEKGLDI